MTSNGSPDAGKRAGERAGFPIRLYDSMRRGLHPLRPCQPGRVTVYGCGPTVYDFAHIGNFRTFITYDLLHRYLRWRGLRVEFLVNFTDVDDKTIKGAKRAGRRLEEHTQPFINAFLEDARTLGFLPFAGHPRATEHIGAMVEFVDALIAGGSAYVTPGGSVYYDVGSFARYGALSGKGDAESVGYSRLSAGDAEKADPRDFALWKAAQPIDREVGAVWDSPWGAGRPGWHLECSVMVRSLLGDTIDIHMGGEDLLFPHHENEIAQSEAVTGCPMARHWMHTKHLRLGDRKMSKSLGNFWTVRDLVEAGHDPAAIRWALMSAHYRSELNVTEAGLDNATAGIQRLLDFRRRLSECRARSPGGGDPKSDEGLLDRAQRHLLAFGAAMDADLNVPRALAALWDLVRDGNAALEARTAPPSRAALDEALAVLAEMDSVLGVLALAARGRDVTATLEARIERRVAERDRARRERRFQDADRIRDELAAWGVQLEDTPSETRWKRVHRPPGDDEGA